MAGWLFRTLKKAHSASFPRLPVFLVLAFVVWAFFSALIGISNGTYYRLSLNELRPLLHYLLILPMLTELKAKQVRRVAAVFLAVSSVLSIRALLLYAQGAGELATYTSGGIRITTVEYVYPLFGFLVAFGLYAARASKSTLLIPVGLLNLAGLVVTFQRAGWLALAASFLFGVFFLKGYRKRFVTVTATAGFLFLALVPLSNLDHQAKSGIVSALVTRAASVGEFQEDLSAQHRLNEWEAAWTMIGEHPFIGSGLGALVTFSSPMYDESRKKLTYLSRDFYMHNSYLWIATKMGALGFGLFLLMLASAVYPAVKEARQSGKDKSALVVGVLLCFVALMVASIFGPCFNSDTITPFASFLLASLIILSVPEQGQISSYGRKKASVNSLVSKVNYGSACRP
jgi:O-antigen ligase